MNISNVELEDFSNSVYTNTHPLLPYLPRNAETRERPKVREAGPSDTQLSLRTEWWVICLLPR